MATWSQNELAELVDDREIRVVAVLTAARARQTEYLTTLYAAGITCAIFEHGHSGASAEEVAELLVRPRSRRDLFGRAPQYGRFISHRLKLYGKALFHIPILLFRPQLEPQQYLNSPDASRHHEPLLPPFLLMASIASSLIFSCAVRSSSSGLSARPFRFSAARVS